MTRSRLHRDPAGTLVEHTYAFRRLKRRRETYLGPWLPEPVSLAPDPSKLAYVSATAAADPA